MSVLAPPMTTRAPRPESERTCVGCRRRAPTRALARLALDSNERQARALVLWGRGRARPGGRGASLHRDAFCLRAALKSGAFARAFRAPVAVGLEDEAELLKQLTGSEDRHS
jgi:uncharacterized protein